MNRSIVAKTLAAAVSAVVVSALAGAFFLLGSPTQQQQRRLDARRVSDLSDIEYSVRSYAKSNGALPPDMQTLASKVSLPVDPDTRAPYEYEPLDAQTYQLCAVFALPSPNRHDAGRQCFKYTRDGNNSSGCR